MRSRSYARSLAASAALAGVLSTTACAGGGTGQTPGWISEALTEPQHLTPSNVTEVLAFQVDHALFTGLVEYDDKTLAPRLGMAQSITTTDNRTWTIVLRPGWTFHNGEPVTSDSFINAWNFAARGSSAQVSAPFFAYIQGYADVHPAAKRPASATTMRGLKRVNDTTFTVTLNHSFVNFRVLLGYPAFYPLPKAALADPRKYDEAPIGNGPFRMQGTWQHNQRIRVERYAGYKGVQPKIKGIEFKIYQNQATAFNDLLAGNVDIVKSVPLDQVDRAKTQLGSRYKIYQSDTLTILGFSLRSGVYRDPRIRKALSMAIDRDEIAAKIFKGTTTPATSYLSSVVAGHRATACGRLCTFDPVRAKQLLAQAGGLRDNTAEITYNVDAGHKPWVEAVCNQIARNLNVTCKPVPVPRLADLINQLQGHQVRGAYRYNWHADYPTADYYLRPLYSCDGAQNFQGFCDRTFDSLLEEGDRAKTAAAADVAYNRAEDALMKEFPAIPLWYVNNATAHSPRVGNVSFSPQGYLNLFTVTAS